MRILIFGAKGNLGTALSKAFDSISKENPLAHNEVIGWDREEIDATDDLLVKKKISELKPDLIINAIAYNAVDLAESEDGMALAEKLNVGVVKSLAEAALENQATIIHYSTDYVFDGGKNEGYAENDEPKPINQYGRSKRAGEEVLIKLSGKGLRWYLLRTSKLFGPRGSSPTAKPSFFDVMLKLAQEKTEIEVVNDELSCFTYTKDLAEATKALFDEDYGYGIYHITNSHPATWFEAAKMLFRLSDMATEVLPVSADRFPRAAKRPKSSVLINNKFITLRDYEEALKDYLKQPE
jgi:dTDP-4-dehydrorhamnose reductase